MQQTGHNAVLFFQWIGAETRRSHKLILNSKRLF
jgi:hypothetical protein